MRRLVSVSVVVVFCLILIGCGSSDPKAVMKDMLDISEAFIQDLDNANDAGGVANAINKYTKKMEGLVPRLKAAAEKYPELKGMQQKLPAGFEEYEERFKAMTEKMQVSGAKMGQFMTDPKVQEAMKKMMEVMQNMWK